jgi:hypothetical protein
MSDDRRELLEAALEQAEEGTLETPTEKEIEVNDDPIQAENTSEESSSEETSRDEKGRFKAQEASSEQDTAEEPDLVAEASDVPDEEIKRPTTWKKEYVEVWEKMQSGKPLDKAEFAKFAEYANQRESEYKKGVSAYTAAYRSHWSIYP